MISGSAFTSAVIVTSLGSGSSSSRKSSGAPTVKTVQLSLIPNFLASGVPEYPVVIKLTNCDYDLSVPRPVELTEIDRLPPSKQNLPARKRHRNAGSDERGFDMSVRVVFKVFEIFKVLRYQLSQKPEHVRFYVRVSVLVDGQSARRVLSEKYTDAFAYIRSRDGPRNLGGDIDHFLTFRRRDLYPFHAHQYTKQVARFPVVAVCLAVIIAKIVKNAVLPEIYFT
jgi:hypothetical protein